MNIMENYITYRDLADQLGCSYQYVAQVISKRIIDAFDIDKKRLPRAGTLPKDCVEKYFDSTYNLKSK